MKRHMALANDDTSLGFFIGLTDSNVCTQIKKSDITIEKDICSSIFYMRHETQEDNEVHLGDTSTDTFIDSYLINAYDSLVFI